MTAWALLRRLLEDGHRATVVALRYPSDPFQSPQRENLVRDLGSDLVVVPVEPSDELPSPAGTVELTGTPTLTRIFPTHRLAPAVDAVLRDAGIDAVFAYHWDALAATHGSRAAPRLGVVDDLWHAPNLRRWQSTRPSPTRAYAYWSLSTIRGLRPTRAAMVAMLQDCDRPGAFQAETAERLRKAGVAACEYLHAPVPDGGGPGWKAWRLESENERPTILLGPSPLEATSTRAGLSCFAKEILPVLERDLGRDGFEVRVVGEGRPPPELARVLPHPGVTITGRIEPADPEFLRANVQLVPTPFVLGKRVRIIAGWSFGCCVVAHAAETVNLPELQDGANALLGRTGKALGLAAVRALREPHLARKLGSAGRDTYERLFHPDVAARGIAERLERLAQGTDRSLV